MSGASTSTASSTVSAWTIAAIGERAPERMLVAVRAIAPVAGMPPRNGVTTLAMPSASSSASGSWRVPAMPSAITADSSDSMPPSMATANAPDISACSVAKVSSNGAPPGPAACQGSIGNGGSGGTPSTTRPPTVAWKRDAIVATACPGKKCPIAAASSAAIGSASSGAGTRFTRRGSRSSIASVAAATTSSASEALLARLPHRRQPIEEVRRAARELQAEARP